MFLKPSKIKIGNQTKTPIELNLAKLTPAILAKRKTIDKLMKSNELVYSNHLIKNLKLLFPLFYL
jgi:hypothetical protein